MILLETLTSKPPSTRRGRTRRHAAKLLGAALLVAVSAACSSGAAGSGAAGAGDSAAPAPGGSLTIGIATEPVCFNPQFTNLQDSYPLVRNVFESLIGRGPDGGYVPWLADKWAVSDDGKVHTLTLREGVTFSTGTPLDATAVKQNLDFVADPGHAARGAASLGRVDHVEAVDPRTVRIVLREPDASLLESLSDIKLAMVAPSTLAAQTGGEQACEPGPKLVGTGPFTFTAYQRGQSVTFARNPGYDWPVGTAGHTGPAYLDQVTYRFLPEASVRSGALTSGQVGAIFGVQATDIATIKGDPALRLLTGPSSGTGFNLNVNPYHGAATDVRVRRALRDGFDLDAIVQSIYRGSAVRAWAPLGPDNPYHDAGLKGTWGADVAGANALLDEAGWTARDSEGYRTKDGQRLRVEVIYPAPTVRDNRDQLISAVAAEAKQNIGLHLDLRVVTNGEYTALAKANTWGIYPASWAAADATQLFGLLGPNGTLYADSPHGGVDSDVVAWTAKSATATEAATRAGYFGQIQRRLIDQALVIPLYYPAFQIASSQDVRGLGFDVRLDTPSNLYDVWLAP
ncbi:peptide ABC transporter substrate-binding protein [Acrocarpospora pleiomorpha]|uniref:Peptide ABC transporter substrate-binding protein n=1 Tax=Acrocarpospora pleiomorpha TaxID=90975 RepID=A0A5M3XPJ2_9ACTN|nr:ABC transporter substrate-binding protein [Acrocarpospora pleiomorpha]GES22780.1 peptide ABC transporter substrate-binding protein [Acrocarpospora pleiomorpha]